MAWSAWRARDERPVASVAPAVKLTLAAALIAQIGLHALAPRPVANAAALRAAPSTAWLHVAALGDSLFASKMLTLYLQAFDNQPGVSIPFVQLDYDVVLTWLNAGLELDPRSQYPLMMAAHLYAHVPDERRTRQMLDFVHRQFLVDPNQRWRWLAHAAIVAKHRLRDLPLALRYAEDITRHASAARSWARQMRIFILEDMGEPEAAAVLLGGLLESGEVTDENEIRFLTSQLEKLKYVGNSSKPSKSR